MGRRQYMWYTLKLSVNVILTIIFIKDIRSILNTVRWAITAGHNTVFHWGLYIPLFIPLRA
jgi:hypothetical protein